MTTLQPVATTRAQITKEEDVENEFEPTASLTVSKLRNTARNDHMKTLAPESSNYKLVFKSFCGGAKAWNGEK